jgi:hypothetical protein
MIENTATDARNNAAPGGAGHTDTSSSSIDAIAADNLGQDQAIRKSAWRFKQRYAELRDRVGTREYGWEATPASAS